MKGGAVEMFDKQTRREFFVALGFASVVMTIPTIAALDRQDGVITLNPANIGLITSGSLRHTEGWGGLGTHAR